MDKLEPRRRKEKYYWVRESLVFFLLVFVPMASYVFLLLASSPLLIKLGFNSKNFLWFLLLVVFFVYSGNLILKGCLKIYEQQK